MREEKNIEVSMVIPLLNERDNLRPLYYQISKVMESIGLNYEVVFIDDGSNDGSFEILKELRESYKNIKLIKFRKNFGKAAALNAGFEASKGEIIITMDADLQDDPREIPKFLEKLNEGYDLVSGWKKVRKDPFSKRIFSKLFNKVVSLVTKIDLNDFNCGFKAYKREVIESVSIYGELHRFIPVLADWKGYKCGEIAVKHRLRVYGKSKYGFSRIIRGFNDFITVTFLRRYIKSPLHFFGVVGLFFIALGLTIVIFSVCGVLFYRYLYKIEAFLVGIFLFVIGVQIFLTGLLAEMITSKDALMGKVITKISDILEKEEILLEKENIIIEKEDVIIEKENILLSRKYNLPEGS